MTLLPPARCYGCRPSIRFRILGWSIPFFRGAGGQWMLFPGAEAHKRYFSALQNNPP
jgi:hypothetical protein